MSSILSDLGRLVLMGLAALAPALAQGQTPLNSQGSEAALSGNVAGNQVYPGLCLGENGGYVVWQDNNAPGGSGWDIQARRLDAQGAGLGVAFRVNQAVANNQERPQVALLPDGGAAFVWQGGPVGFQTIFARFMSAGGAFLTDDLQLNRAVAANTNRVTLMLKVIRNNRPVMRRFLYKRVLADRRDTAASPAVATLANGNVVVAYAGFQRYTTNAATVLPMVRMYGSQPVTNSILVPQQQSQDNAMDVFCRLYTPAGQALGAERRVNQVLKYSQSHAALAALPNGNFVIAWVSENQGVSESDLLLGNDRRDVYARVFNADGLPLGGEFLLNDSRARDNVFPALAPALTGGFRAVWAQESPVAANGLDIVTRVFDAAGAPVSDTLRVNRYTAGDQYAPRVAACPAGELVVWTSMNQETSGESVYGRWFTAGAWAENELRINTSTALRQSQQSVTANTAGRVLVAWSGLRRLSSLDVFAQRFSAGNL